MESKIGEAKAKQVKLKSKIGRVIEYKSKAKWAGKKANLVMAQQVESMDIPAEFEEELLEPSNNCWDFRT